MRQIFKAALALLGIATIAVAVAAYLIDEATRQTEQEAKAYA